MSFRSLKFISATTIFCALAISSQLAAQQNQEHNGTHHRYKLIDLGTFGGPLSFFSDGNPPLTKIVNNRGIGVGTADTAVPDPYSPNCLTDCFVAHTFQWKDGVLTDLGALPGVNSGFPIAINERGLIVGVSENGVIDPLTGFPEAVAVLWRDGKIVDLGTLGGNASLASAINERGQVVGVALNATPDPFSSGLNYFFVFPVGTQARAFLWENGEMNDLGTLGGPDSVASYVNERGEVAGESFLNSIPNSVTGLPTQDPFLWVPCRDRGDSDSPDKGDCKNGKMLDLGTLGGASGLVAGLNNRGQVIGQSNLAGDKTHHPFLWERGHITDLGTLGGDFGFASWLNDKGEVVGTASLPIPCPGCGEGPQIYHAFFWKHGVMKDLGTLDKCSLGNGINNKSQIVGASGLCGIAKHAFLSEDGGPIIDLNTLIPPDSGLTLTGAIYINDRGEIAGFGLSPNGNEHAYLLIPCDSDHPGVQACDYDPVDLDALSESTPANSRSSKTENQHPTLSRLAHKIHR
jgi:probable HAF family extracellular repeat protein